jgi:hypothetical protein
MRSQSVVVEHWKVFITLVKLSGSLIFVVYLRRGQTWKRLEAFVSLNKDIVKPLWLH